MNNWKLCQAPRFLTHTRCVRHTRSYLFNFLNDFIWKTTLRHAAWFMSAIYVIKINIQGIKIFVNLINILLFNLIFTHDLPATSSFARLSPPNESLSIFRAAKSRFASAHLMRQSLKENLIKFLIVIAANNLWIISRLLVRAPSLAIILTSHAV